MAAIKWVKRTSKPTHIVLHHCGCKCYGKPLFDAIDRNYKRKGQPGNPYNAQVEPNGSIRYSVPLDMMMIEGVKGAIKHSRNANKYALSICITGDTVQEKDIPTAAQLKAAAKLIREWQVKFGIPDRNVIEHKNVPGDKTDCPGSLTVAEVLKHAPTPNLKPSGTINVEIPENHSQIAVAGLLLLTGLKLFVSLFSTISTPD